MACIRVVQGKGETYDGMGHWHPSLSAGEELYGLALLIGYTERHNPDTQPLRLTTRLAFASTTPRGQGTQARPGPGLNPNNNANCDVIKVLRYSPGTDSQTPRCSVQSRQTRPATSDQENRVLA